MWCHMLLLADLVPGWKARLSLLWMVERAVLLVACGVDADVQASARGRVWHDGRPSSMTWRMPCTGLRQWVLLASRSREFSLAAP